MNNQKENRNKLWSGFFVLGFMSIIIGLMMVIEGIEAYKTGEIIPQTWKSGSMSGVESIVIGSFAIIVGLIFLRNELLKKRQ